MTQTIPVTLGARSYDVRIGPDLIAQAGAMVAPFAPSGRVFIVTDDNVERLHLEALEQSLAAEGLATDAIVVPPGEATKSFIHLEMLCGSLLQADISRRDIVIAFGGGVIGDLAGFAAGIVKRGVGCVQIPTTLLAQVDSSVGGKTAIDTPEGKNLVGLFHQPRLVLADTRVLATLPARELRAGYAEIVKIGLLQDAAFFWWCEANAAAVLAHDDAALAHAIRHAVAAKAAIVAADENEQGERALLNLGHTFGHALEAHGDYGGALLHGEAVAAGMALAFQLSADLGLCSAQDAERVRAHLSAAGFTTDLRQLPGAPYDAEALLTLMARDKKAHAGKLALVLVRGIGRAFLEPDAPADAVRELLIQETKAT